MTPSSIPNGRKLAVLLVIDPNGNRTRAPIGQVPFRIGRQPESDLVIRDSRVSRQHARIVIEGGDYVLEDTHSRHGTLVNGARIERHRLQDSDRIEFGFPDSTQLIFKLEDGGPSRLLDSVSGAESVPGITAGPAQNLAKLRAVLEMARAVEMSGTTREVLAALVDAALAITGMERGFLLVKQGEELEMRVARDRYGRPLPENDLRVPRSVIQRALQRRRELLSMNFETHDEGFAAGHSIADLDLRSVISVPLVRIRTTDSDATNVLASAGETAGVLYMDSRIGAADLSAGNRELLQALAIEASTILENARLLEEERAKQRMEEELNVARTIQRSLLPRQLPAGGWFRAAGSSLASHQVGGDYFDVFPAGESAWATVVADVSGKGVSSALLATLLQGAFLATAAGAPAIETIERINRFLGDRTEGEKYATIFYSWMTREGSLSYINAGHCPPLLVRNCGELESLKATAMPVGMFSEAAFAAATVQLSAGDKVVVYSDGVTEARDRNGEFFGATRLREIAVHHAAGSCQELHAAIQDAVVAFTEGAPQADDITLVVIEYRPA